MPTPRRSAARAFFTAARDEDSDDAMSGADPYWDEEDEAYDDWPSHEEEDEDYEDYDDYESEEQEEEQDEEQDEEDEYVPRRRDPPPAPLAPPPPTLCRFFVLGKCRYGSRCTFSHALPTAGNGDTPDEVTMATVAATMVDCPFFQRGNCKYGQFCRLRHAPSVVDNQCGHSAGSTRVAASSTTCTPVDSNQQEFTCGICFEDIVEAGKHFGLLSCDHCFCLDCLRSWRQSKDMEVEVTRACPACRVPSNYIVPSLKFCTGDEKLAVVDAYKRHLAIRECKYFDGSFGSCPFGPNCFYAHRNSAGVDVKHLDRARRSRRRSDSDDSFLSALSRGSRRGGGRRPYPDALSSILDRYNEFFRFLESFEWDEHDLLPDGR